MKKIIIFGASGLLGKAVCRLFQENKNYKVFAPTKAELDLCDLSKVLDYAKKVSPDYIIQCAARVGGIKANIENPYEFLMENSRMNLNVLDAVKKHPVEKLILIGSNCMYPKECEQPMREEFIGLSPCEPTNEAFAYSKLLTLKALESFNKQFNTSHLMIIPASLYGERENKNVQDMHVLCALVERMSLAKKKNDPEFVVWGSGNPKREFLHVDDAASAILYLLENNNLNETAINIGTGIEISIRDLVLKIKEKLQYKGQIKFDTSKPEGIFRKLLDHKKLSSTGWVYKINFDEGLEEYIKRQINETN